MENRFADRSVSALSSLAACQATWEDRAIQRGAARGAMRLSEAAILAALEEVYRADKVARGSFDWKGDRQHSRILRIPLACDCGPDIMGASIIGTAYRDEPNRRVSFQLCADVDGQDYRVARIDWKPNAPHTNRYGESKGLTLYTSVHDFQENAALGLGTMQTQNLPIVCAIDPEPEDFPALLGCLRDKFKVVNAQDVPVPQWSFTLQV